MTPAEKDPTDEARRLARKAIEAYLKEIRSLGYLDIGHARMLTLEKVITEALEAYGREKADRIAELEAALERTLDRLDQTVDDPDLVAIEMLREALAGKGRE